MSSGSRTVRRKRRKVDLVLGLCQKRNWRSLSRDCDTSQAPKIERAHCLSVQKWTSSRFCPGLNPQTVLLFLTPSPNVFSHPHVYMLVEFNARLGDWMGEPLRVVAMGGGSSDNTTPVSVGRFPSGLYMSRNNTDL